MTPFEREYGYDRLATPEEDGHITRVPVPDAWHLLARVPLRGTDRLVDVSLEVTEDGYVELRALDDGLLKVNMARSSGNAVCIEVFQWGTDTAAEAG